MIIRLFVLILFVFLIETDTHIVSIYIRFFEWNVFENSSYAFLVYFHVNIYSGFLQCSRILSLSLDFSLLRSEKTANARSKKHGCVITGTFLYVKYYAKRVYEWKEILLYRINKSLYLVSCGLICYWIKNSLLRLLSYNMNRNWACIPYCGWNWIECKYFCAYLEVYSD